MDKWQISTKSESQPELRKLAMVSGLNGDLGMYFFKPNSKHYVSHKLRAPFSLGQSNLALQFEVMTDGKMDYGEVLVALLTGPYDPKSLDDNTSYAIKFGPIKRLKPQHEDRVHLSFQVPAPNGLRARDIIEGPQTMSSRFSSLYSLFFTADGMLEMKINNHSFLSTNQNIIFGSGLQPEPITGIALMVKTSEDCGIFVDNIIVSSDFDTVKSFTKDTWEFTLQNMAESIHIQKESSSKSTPRQ